MLNPVVTLSKEKNLSPGESLPIRFIQGRGIN